jgi:hypothetical protein
MDIHVESENAQVAHSYSTAFSALRSLPDSCAENLSEIAVLIGADKLELIQWMRSDIRLARLLASKLTT